MARYSSDSSENIYEAAEQFREECLRRDGSLFFDRTPLWTVDNLTKLHEVFVGSPDEGERTFTDKFRDQIRPAGQPVIRLAAEVLAVYFLFPSNVGAFRKRELVGEVLSWAGDSLPAECAVAKAFATGIGSGGQGYNARQPYEIGFLIEFCLKWKKLSPDEQAKALGDPWQFESAIDATEGAETRQIRQMLLHLLFPDDFERIASSSHKGQVVNAFKELIVDSTNNQDQDKLLLQIRRRLEGLLPDQELDLYESPLRAAWYDESEGFDDFPDLEMSYDTRNKSYFTVLRGLARHFARKGLRV